MATQQDVRLTGLGRIPSTVPIERASDGTWHVHSFVMARKLLRGDATRQAGFKADLLERLPRQGNVPILFLEGAPHHEQRRLTAPFFTPRAVDTRYRELMGRLGDKVIARLARNGRAELSAMGMEMAVGVASEVVGLTNSRSSGLDRRINAFFSGGLGQAGGRLRNLWQAFLAQVRLARFYWLDVRPSIAARRKYPREDVISHLLSQGYRDSEILTECITYGAAGMVTTREFITVCAWHLLNDALLRARYLAADEASRHTMLEEVLRLEPVVGTLFRRTTADISFEEATIPAGALVAIDIRAVNADPAVSGEAPLTLDPERCPMHRAGSAVMSFGDGHHRCPGGFLALQETDIFLMRLLRLPGLRLERAPDVSWNDLVTGYELRHAWLRCDAGSGVDLVSPDANEASFS